jgi:hypothetical protein
MARAWIAAYAAILLSMTWVAGCSNVAKPYRVDTGLDPAYQDDEVRFRTTYYMRVYEVCPIQGDSYREYEKRFVLTGLAKGVPHIVKDSLYRFRMTGQASALYSNLRFESGVLQADEVEPFGKSIEYDATANKFKTSSETKLLGQPSASVTSAPMELCPNGKPLEKKLFLLGPQGVRLLNHNDRLVMAMYTDSKPLIGALKRLTGQQANESAKALLPYDLETARARADKTTSLLKEATLGSLKDSSPGTTVNRLLPLFESSASSAQPVPESHGAPHSE